MAFGLEAAHVDADLRHHHLGRKAADARDGGERTHMDPSYLTQASRKKSKLPDPRGLMSSTLRV
jgi:hypothetical protein